MPGRPGSSSQRPVWVLAQRPAATAGQALPPGSSGRPDRSARAPPAARSSARRSAASARARRAPPSCASRRGSGRGSRRAGGTALRRLWRCFLVLRRSRCARGSSSTGGAVVSTTNDSAGPMLRMSIVSSANTHRCACGWKLCHAMPRSRLKTYQRIFWPAWATIVGVLPMNERPLKQNDGRLAPPASMTLCVAGGTRVRPPHGAVQPDRRRSGWRTCSPGWRPRSRTPSRRAARSRGRTSPGRACRRSSRRRPES